MCWCFRRSCPGHFQLAAAKHQDSRAVRAVLRSGELPAGHIDSAAAGRYRPDAVGVGEGAALNIQNTAFVNLNKAVKPCDGAHDCAIPSNR